MNDTQCVQKQSIDKAFFEYLEWNLRARCRCSDNRLSIRDCTAYFHAPWYDRGDSAYFFYKMVIVYTYINTLWIRRKLLVIGGGSMLIGFHDGAAKLIVRVECITSIDLRSVASFRNNKGEESSSLMSRLYLFYQWKNSFSLENSSLFRRF